MTHVLPSNASLEQLKNQAKDLLNLHKERNPDACTLLRLLHRFEDAPDDDILGAALKLTDCQFALAMDYGFKSWPELKKHLESSIRSPSPGNTLDRVLKLNAYDAYKDVTALRTAIRIILAAIEDNVSDLHVESRATAVSVRFRIDGVLTEVESLAKEDGEAVALEIIHLGKMDPTERRFPQDGRCTIMLADRKVIARTSVVPSAHGPVLALRVLDRARMIESLDELGFEPPQLERYRRLINMPSGLILVNGFTGVGKSTTLYATLSELNHPTKKIVTIEDPIEYLIDGIDQMPLKNGLSFANALRAVLRQAATVILVGEIRDPDTATIIFPAALTGHLVFSTLPAETAPRALRRLMDLGVEPFVIADGVKGMVDQQIRRRICPHCKVERQPSGEELEAVGLSGTESTPTFFKGEGCAKCRNTGYRGRVGIFSVLEMTEDVKSAVMTQDRRAIVDAAKASGWQSLREVALEKAIRGEISLEDVLTLE